MVKAEVEALSDLTVALLAANDGEAAAEAVAQIQLLLPQNDISDSWDTPRTQWFQACAALELWRGDTASARAALLQARMIYKRNPTVNPLGYLITEAQILDVLGQVEEYEGSLFEASVCFTTAAIIYRQESQQVKTAALLSRLCQVLDDDTAASLLESVMLPLHRFDHRRHLASSLLHGAKIALRRSQRQLASHRARCALRLFEETRDSRGSERARDCVASAEAR
ncbi:hypothetical protein EXIGLDRAFT_155417 [Exidia glandulosa HHB12029]|uniref:MalT-like TPR region domain-containing protein n=1 Tax=Exidia glandulosa HHB12029 TaxID=1314781 RepID=A0A165QIQ4_EXIGL|nr:hypothetical protein EXIGLDRAFT_155417 [Exidia glandulosa HHB12029]